MLPINKTGLGTVQFGVDYGISNTSGIVAYNEVVDILKAYQQANPMPVYDTAIGYGSSEEVLGKAFAEAGITQPAVVSKFAGSDLTENEESIGNAAKGSIQRLGIESLYGFISHDANLLINNPYLLDKLNTLKEKGLIRKQGLSAYFPWQVEWFLDKGLPIDLIQVPYNIFDQRFDRIFSRCKAAGIEIHTRSAFMQGLIFKDLSFFTGYFAPFYDKIVLLQSLSQQLHQPISTLAFSFCLGNENINRVIIGVNSEDNLQHNLSVNTGDVLLTALHAAKDQLALQHEDLLLPFNWPQP